MELSDQALLRQYANRQDAEAFAQIVLRHAGVVYGACLRVAGNAHDAEDAAQECFLDLARHAGSVTTSLPGWLHVAATNHALMLLRKNATRSQHESRARAIPRANTEPEWSDIAPLIDEALKRLPEADRLPLVLHFLQGKNQDQVAAELGVSQPTVSRRIERGVSLLRDQLKRSGVIASVAVVGTLMAHNAATAAPATLYTALGKLALSGIGAAGKGALAASAGASTGASGITTAAAITGGGIAVKIAISSVIAVALITGGVVVHNALAQRQAQVPARPAAAPAAAVTNAPKPLSEIGASTAAVHSTNLPNGARVQLVGIALYPRGDSPWWMADGTVMEKAPCADIEPPAMPTLPKETWDRVLGTTLRQPNMRQLAVLVDSFPGSDASVQLAAFPWGECHAVGMSMQSPQPPERSTSKPGLWGLLVAFPDDPPAAGIRVGVSAGEWNITGRGLPDRPNSFMNREGRASFHVMSETLGNAQLTTTDSFVDRDIRLVAVDEKGTVNIGRVLNSEMAEKSRTITSVFENVKLAQVKEFQLQTRPVQWAEFMNVSLRPGTKTEVRVTVTQDSPPLTHRMREGIAGAGFIRTTMGVYKANHGGEYPTFNDAKGDALGEIGIQANDLTGKYFGPADYSVTSSPAGCTITARLEAETFTINDLGEESGTFKTR